VKLVVPGGGGSPRQVKLNAMAVAQRDFGSSWRSK
jgi:hypothetical protein